MELSSHLSSDKTGKPAESRITLVKTRVIICTNSYTFSGAVVHIQQQRILDVLNRGSIVDLPRIDTDFLQMEETEVWSRTSKKERIELGTCYIVKHNILFAVELGRERYVASAKTRMRSVTFRRKAQRLVNVHVPPYLLTGQLYMETQQKVSYILATSEDFLPMTYVEINPPMVMGDVAADFAAVNKHHIAFISEIE